MGDSAHTTHHTNPGKKSAPLLFLEDENIFQKSASVVAPGIGYIIIDSDIGYFAILLQISGFAQILISGYSHFAANFRIFVG
jgi:hypothetical protein